MASIRRRLTLWYVVALVVSIAAFGGAAVLRAAAVESAGAGRATRARRQSGGAVLLNFQRQLGRIAVFGGDADAESTRSAATSRRSGTTSSWWTRTARRSTGTRPPSPSAWSTLADVLATLSAPEGAGVRSGFVRLDADSLIRFVTRRSRSPGCGSGPPPISSPLHSPPCRLVRSTPGRDAGHRPSDPVGVSIGLGYVLADTSLRPLEGMVDELESITDGRGLHRRLAVPLQAEELARLSNTVNRMLGSSGRELRQPAPLHRRCKP